MINLSNITFGGFYHSIHSDLIEDKIETFGYNMEQVNYVETQLNYIEALLCEIKELEYFNLKIDRPKYYNYSTDTISLTVNSSFLENFNYKANGTDVIEFLEVFQDKVDDVTTRKPGYMPFFKFNQLIFDYKYKCEVLISWLIETVDVETLNKLDYEITLHE